MAKIFSGLTLVVALAAILLGFQSKGLVEKLKTNAERVYTDLESAQNKLKKVEKELADTKAELTTTKEELGKTKDALAKAEAESTKAKGELAAETEKLTASVTELDALKKKIEEITKGKKPEDLEQEIAAKDAKVKELEAKAMTLESDNAAMKLTVDTLTSQKREFDEKLASQRKKLERYEKNIMQKGVRGEVLAVNAGWGFCVLSIGDRRGAAANKIMIVARNGQAIGKVKIINGEASQSVADIIPSSFVRGTYVQPGDEVIYTGDDKVREEPAAAVAPASAPATSTAPGVPALPVQ
jgi:septal ring factor EnvC (AmiA/AmiB activator)